MSQTEQVGNVKITLDGHAVTMIHETIAYYDGECVYAWSCECGDGESDFLSLIEADAAGTLHALDEAVAASREARKI